MAFYFEITKNIQFLIKEFTKVNVVLLLNFTFCMYFWSVKILIPNMSNCLFLHILCFYLICVNVQFVFYRCWELLSVVPLKHWLSSNIARLGLLDLSHWVVAILWFKLCDNSESYWSGFSAKWAMALTWERYEVNCSVAEAFLCAHLVLSVNISFLLLTQMNNNFISVSTFQRGCACKQIRFSYPCTRFMAHAAVETSQFFISANLSAVYVGWNKVSPALPLPLLVRFTFSQYHSLH